MQRVFDFVPAESEIVVSRILLQVHQAIDESFPHARPASQRFAKTAFTGSDEPTLTQQIPIDALKDAQLLESGLDSLDVSGRGGRTRPWEAGLEESNELKTLTSSEHSRWSRKDNIPLKQTLIGVLTLILVALVAYLILTF